MSCNSHKFLGYHGTTRQSAEYIIYNKRFPMSIDDEEWLGHGVYFFENDKLQAIDWCLKARRYPEWAVIKSDIDATVVVDLIDKETFNGFKKIANKIKGKYKTKKDRTPRKLINSVVLNMIYEIEKYDMVRAVFPVPSEEIVDRTNIMPTQIQLCVRNRNCITTIEEVECI